MSPLPETPHGAFRFTVELGDGEQAGFAEVSGLSTALSVMEYRNGNDAAGFTRKIPGLRCATEVRLRRGLTGSRSLLDWMKAAADGHPARRNVTVLLMGEAQGEVVLSWKLARAFPIRYAGPALAAAGNEIAIEELVLACESVTVG